MIRFLFIFDGASDWFSLFLRGLNILDQKRLKTIDIPEGPNIPKVLNFHSHERYYSSSFIYPQVGEATIGLPIWIAFSPQELVSERTPANSCQECVCVACCLDRRGHNVCVLLVVYDKIGLRWRGHYIWNDEKM